MKGCEIFPESRSLSIKNYFVGVRFFQDDGVLSSKTYTYLTEYSSYKKGDLAVVKVGSKYKIVYVAAGMKDLTTEQRLAATRPVFARII